MADERDFRIRMDLCLPPGAINYTDQIREALAPFIQHGVVINEGQDNEERGYIEVERCGHRLKLPCEVLARWEVGRGQVLP